MFRKLFIAVLSILSANSCKNDRGLYITNITTEPPSPIDWREKFNITTNHTPLYIEPITQEECPMTNYYTCITPTNLTIPMEDLFEEGVNTTLNLQYNLHNEAHGCQELGVTIRNHL